MPLGWKTWMRLLKVSATAIRSPEGANTADIGFLNCPSPVPDAPNAWSNVPLGWKTWMRLLPASATANARPRLTPAPGALSGCAPEAPDMPDAPPAAPVGPAVGAAAPKSGGGGSSSGAEWGNCAYARPAAPDAPNRATNSPSAPTTCTRLLPVSATAIKEPPGEKSTDMGASNWPAAEPREPDSRANSTARSSGPRWM